MPRRSPARPPEPAPALRESSVPAPSAPSGGARFERLDALRGFALVWMAVFHFCFDLSHFGLIEADFYRDPAWTLQRTCILSLFLLCAGAGQAVAHQQRQSWPRFWRRWAQIAGCAMLVSAGSWLMFPRSYISFGVLHGMAVMLLLLRTGAGLGRGWLVLGALALALPLFVQHPWFDSRATNWLGLVTHKPVTEDYVPLLPWLGVMALGFVATQQLLRAGGRWIGGPLPQAAPLRALAVLGRWSLSFYMLHQPVLIGLLQGWLLLKAPTPA